jgi:hypothetical protein
MWMCLVSLWVPTNWVVDAANGPGTNFLDLPAAIAAAADGDTILVRAGSYTGFLIQNKALTIRGAGRGTTFVGDAAGAQPSHVDATPAGLEVVLSGLTLRGPSGGLVVQGNAHVVLLECAVEGVTSSARIGSDGLHLADSAQVFAVGCAFAGGDAAPSASPFDSPKGGNGVFAEQSSRFVADRCSLHGGDSLLSPTALSSVGGAGLYAFGARVRLDRCQSTGGDGTSSGGNGVLCLADAYVRVCGDAQTVVVAGLNGSGVRGLAILAYQFSLGVEVHGPVTRIGGAAGYFLTGATELPRLDVVGTTVPSGETDATQLVTATLDGLLPSAPYLFVLGLRPLYGQGLPPLVGDLLLDLTITGWFPGVLDGAGLFQFSFVPQDVFGGGSPFPFYSQCAVIDPATGDLRLSNLDARLYSL